MNDLLKTVEKIVNLFSRNEQIMKDSRKILFSFHNVFNASVVRKWPANVFYEQKPFSGSRSFFAGLNVKINNLFFASVAQLDRASDFESEGWGFKSLRVYM